MSGISAVAWASPARIPVSQAGLYSVTYGALGFTQPVAVDQLHLSNRGLEVAMTVNDTNSDGLFEAGDSIEFYGQAIVGNDPEFKFTEENIYWLDIDSNLPVRAKSWQAASTGTPESIYRATVHFEKNWTYWQAMPNGVGKDHWFWGERLISGDSRDFPIMLNKISNTSSAIVRVALHGSTDPGNNPDHQTRIKLNGADIGVVTWDGEKEIVQAFTVNSLLLRDGLNTVSFTQGGLPNVSIDSAYVNWIEVEYDREFVAENDQLLFSFQGSGPVDFSITGFTANNNNVLVYDISDPMNVRRVTIPVVSGNVEFADFICASENNCSSGTVIGFRTYMLVGESEIRQVDPNTITFQDLAPTLRASNKGADYIIITHEDLLGADIDRLAQHRRVDGYQVEVVTTQEIYDTFSGGLFTPVAIKEFLRYAYNNWSPVPQFVVLIGDANLDYKDDFNIEQSLGTKFVKSQFVPTYAVETTGIGETPSDNWFVTVGQDALPKIYIGRIPAKSTGDIRLAVDKIIAYETSAPATWQTRFLMTSGDHDPNFVQQTDAWLSKYIIPSGYRPLRVSLRDYSATEKVLAKGDFRKIINGEGVLVSSYFGHGGVNGWIASSGFEVLNSAEATNTLTNDRALPFFVAFNCLNGFFAQPSEGLTFSLPDGSGSFFYDVPLSEALLFHPNGGGAIAMWSPNALAYPTEQEFIGDNLFSLMIKQGVTRLGEATTKAKVQAVVDGKANAENLDIFILIGDPATRLALGTASNVSGGSSGGGGGGGGGVLNLYGLFLLFLWGVVVVKHRNLKA